MAGQQEKAQLKANVALQRLAAKRAMVSQGLAAAAGSAASAAAEGGVQFPARNKTKPSASTSITPQVFGMDYSQM